MPLDVTSDSDDDIFFQGGRQFPTSIYTLTKIASASSDEEDEPQDETPAKRSRGRPKKVHTIVTDAPREKKPKTSVFEISSDDEPEIVVQKELDEHDKAVDATLENARAVLAQGDIDALAREADAEMERERALREEEEERRRRIVETERRAKEEEAEKARRKMEQGQGSSAGAASKDSNAIQFQIRLDEARKIRVRIRRTDPIMKILPPFCKRFALLPKDVVMKVDGEQVGEKDTPDSLDCDDGMQIDVAFRKR